MHFYLWQCPIDPSHIKKADDQLNATRMNVGPAGKQPSLRDTVWNEQVQRMVCWDGKPKFMQERGVDTKGGQS